MKKIDAEIEEFLTNKENYAFAQHVCEMYPQALENGFHRFLNQLKETWKKEKELDALKPTLEDYEGGEPGIDFALKNTKKTYYFFSLSLTEEGLYSSHKWGVWFKEEKKKTIKEIEEVLKGKITSGWEYRDDGCYNKTEDMAEIFATPEETIKRFIQFMKETAPELEKIFDS